MAVHTLEHPELGVVEGIDHGSTIQYLGLKYASLQSGFSAPALYQAPKGGITSATRFGPTAPSPTNALQSEFALIQHDLPSSELTQSATECLNLNITSPNQPPAKGLPVVVFLHGGGFAIGANSWPQYDFRRLVELSIQAGAPIIGINVNYRLGAFGFLHSEELVDEDNLQNNALHDQRTALLWIKQFISGFGGDPLNVTLVGESAGGVSATLHLQSDIPLFTRLVSMGGTDLLLKPLPAAVNKNVYESVLHSLNLDQLPLADRAVRLKQTASDDIFSTLSAGIPFLPSTGGELDLRTNTYEDVYQGQLDGKPHPGKQWCRQIMIGDCQMDGSIFQTIVGPWRPGSIPRFKASITNTLGEEKANRILDAYAITDDDTEENYLRILYFGNDICFLAPVLVYAHGWDGNAFVYFFNEPNTWEGPWKGFANHVLDVAYLFQNYNEHVGEAQRATAEEFGRNLIAYANGQAPWPVFDFASGALNVKVFGPGRGGEDMREGRVQVVSGPSPRSGQRQTIFELSREIPLTKLSEIWTAFQCAK